MPTVVTVAAMLKVVTTVVTATAVAVPTEATVVAHGSGDSHSIDSTNQEE